LQALRFHAQILGWNGYFVKYIIADISLDEFEFIKVGTMGLYVYGMIQYRIMDTEHSMHLSQFSFVYNPEFNEFEACEGFTDMD
jgi:hypothetical protein